MGKVERRILAMDEIDRGVVINALNDKRNAMIEAGQSTEDVDDVLLKAIDAPVKKVRLHGVPEKSDDFLGRGRATERASFCPHGAKRAERSLRGRDDEAR